MTLPQALRPPVKPNLADRRILFLMALAGFVAGYGGAVITNTLPYSRAGLDVTEGQMSLILAIARIVSLAAVVFSISGDRRGRRGPFLVAFAMLPVANLATAFAPNAATFAIFQSVARLGLIATGVLGLVLLAEELTPAVRGYGLGLQALATAAGVGLSLVLVPFASNGDNWRVVFGLTGIGLAALPILLRFLGESRAFEPDGLRVSFSEAMGRGMGRVFWPLAGVSFFVHAFSAVTLDFSLERLISDLEWEAGAAIFLLAVTSGVGTAGTIIGGRLADTSGRRSTAVTAMFLGVAGGLGFYWFSSGWPIALAVFVGTLGSTMLAPVLAAWRAEVFPTPVRATAAHWVTNVSIVGSGAGLLVGFLLIDRIGLPMTVAILGLGMLLAISLTSLVPETRGRVLVRPTTGASRGGNPPAPPSSPRSTTTPH